MPAANARELRATVREPASRATPPTFLRPRLRSRLRLWPPPFEESKQRPHATHAQTRSASQTQTHEAGVRRPIDQTGLFPLYCEPQARGRAGVAVGFWDVAGRRLEAGGALRRVALRAGYRSDDRRPRQVEARSKRRRAPDIRTQRRARRYPEESPTRLQPPGG